MKRNAIAIILLAAMATHLIACTKSEEADEVLPELSDESCKPENIAKLKRLEDRRLMHGSCASRGHFKKSLPREW